MNLASAVVRHHTDERGLQVGDVHHQPIRVDYIAAVAELVDPVELEQVDPAAVGLHLEAELELDLVETVLEVDPVAGTALEADPVVETEFEVGLGTVQVDLVLAVEIVLEAGPVAGLETAQVDLAEIVLVGPAVETGPELEGDPETGRVVETVDLLALGVRPFDLVGMRVVQEFPSAVVAADKEPHLGERLRNRDSFEERYPC